MQTFVSALSARTYPISERIPVSSIRPSLLALIRAEHPELPADGFIAAGELNIYREQYIADYLRREVDELSDLEHTVINSLRDKTLLSDKTDLEMDAQLTTGQRMADTVARFGGSWRFIILFGSFLVIWIVVNAVWLRNRAFDPFPFILLNLMLSCLAAIQAPLIMMSQNRQEEKDRRRAKKDYMINLKSEVEIRMLHEKLDHLIMHQQQKLLEIQQLQIEMMHDIFNKLK